MKFTYLDIVYICTVAQIAKINATKKKIHNTFYSNSMQFLSKSIFENIYTYKFDNIRTKACFFFKEWSINFYTKPKKGTKSELKVSHTIWSVALWSFKTGIL